MRLAFLLKPTQFAVFSQKNYVQSELESIQNNVKYFKIYEKVGEAFIRDFDGEKNRNAERIIELQARQAELGKPVLADGVYKVDAAAITEVYIELSIRQSVPKTVDEFKMMLTLLSEKKTEIQKKIRYFEYLAADPLRKKITNPEALYVWNLYLKYARTLAEIKSRPQFSDCGLSDVEIYAVYFYTTSGYQMLNESLRLRKSDFEMKAFVQLIGSGLAKIQKYEGLVIRGENVRPAKSEQMKVGSEVLFPSFTSSSRVHGFTKSHTLNIRSHEGRYIAPISDLPGEEEVLFLPGTTFKVLEVKEKEFLLEEVPLNKD